jgi:hypothetical protein
MNNRRVRVGIAFLGLAVALIVAYGFSDPAVTPNVPVRMVVTGPDGQRFSGSYVANGVAHAVSGMAPATFGVQANDVTWQFIREGDAAGEFRVALYVGDLCRTSATSGRRPGVQGAFKHTATSESYWGAGF